ncbi:MAG: HEPN domain-containing protein [Thiomicrorhabdus sp.]|jgi:HEPN domain-containing protein|nr:HEPN domain-containing protein [Thiomicrorhabdus sp.]
MKSISADWLKSARSDLLTMEALLGRAELTAVVAFHAQQCVEKVLKAIIEEHELSGIKSHDLITLNGIVLKVWDIGMDEDTLALLNKLYIDSRYPGALGFLPHGAPDISEAKGFFEFAGNLFEIVNARLGAPTEAPKSQPET